MTTDYEYSTLHPRNTNNHELQNLDMNPQDNTDKAKGVSTAELGSTASLVANPTPKKKYDRSGGLTWEIGGCILAIVSIALLIGFLGYVNGMKYASWQYSISPNAVISVISAFAKAAMLLPVSSCLGQVKWKSNTPMPLYNFHVLDQASRGPWGAMEVFWRVRSGLAIAGAALMVFSVALDPFAQQILSFPSRDIPALNETAHVQKAQEYSPKWDQSIEQYVIMEPTMQTAMLTGLAEINTPLDPVCPSGTCTYPDFATLGLCSQCDDVTKTSIQNCQAFTKSSSQWKTWESYGSIGTNSTYKAVPADCSYTTPDGYHFTPDISTIYEDDDDDLVITRQPFTSLPTASGNPFNDTALIISFFTAKYANTLTYTKTNKTAIETKPTMTQCSITFCEKQYTNNHITPNSSTLTPSRSQPLAMEDTSSLNEFHLVPEDGASTYSSNSTYSIDVYTLEPMLMQMRTLLNTTLIPKDWEQNIKPNSQGVQLAPIMYNSKNIAEASNRMATSMTDIIRSSTKATTIDGQAYLSETFIHVRWEWIILPLGAVVFSVALFIATAVACRGQPVLWKSSVFPLLMGQVKTVPEHDIGHLRHLDDLQSASKRIKVVVKDQDGLILFDEYEDNPVVR